MDRLPRTALAVASVLLAAFLDLVLADDCSLGKKIPVFGCTPNVLGMVAACLFVLVLLTIGCCFYRGCYNKPKKKQVPTVTGGLSSEPATTETFPMAPPPYSQAEQPYTGAQVYFVRPFPGAENPPQPVPGSLSTWTEPPPPYSTDTKAPL